MANGHGGRREGAGRKSTREEYVEDGEQTPIEYLLEVMRDTSNKRHERMEAAKAAIPYCSARLQHTDLDVDSELHIYLVSQLEADAADD